MAARLSSWKSPTVVTLTILAVGSVQGATYYVSPTGADANPGTQQQPWKTLEKSSARLQPGDTLVLMEGTYREGPLRFERSGTAAKPIRIEAAAGATVILTYPKSGPEMKEETWDNPFLTKLFKGKKAVSYYSVLDLEKASHLRFRGITFQGYRDQLYRMNIVTIMAAASCVELNASQDVTFQQCIFRGNGHCGIKVGDRPVPQNILIEDCQILDNGTTVYDHGIYADAFKNLTLRRNVFEQNQGYAIQLSPNGYLTIEDNVLRHNGAGILFESHNVTLRRNVIAWNGRKDDGPDGFLMGGIIFRGPTLANNLVEENTVFANTTELNFDPGPGFGKNTIVRKNTFTSQWINLETDGVASPNYPYTPVLTNKQAVTTMRKAGSLLLDKTKDNVQQLQGDLKEHEISAAFGPVTDPAKYNLVFEDNVFQLSTAGSDPTPTPPTTSEPSTTSDPPTTPKRPKR